MSEDEVLWKEHNRPYDNEVLECLSHAYTIVKHRDVIGRLGRDLRLVVVAHFWEHAVKLKGLIMADDASVYEVFHLSRGDELVRVILLLLCKHIFNFILQLFESSSVFGDVCALGILQRDLVIPSLEIDNLRSWIARLNPTFLISEPRPEQVFWYVFQVERMQRIHLVLSVLLSSQVAQVLKGGRLFWV